MRKLILLHGLPGSGKSTLCKQLIAECPSPLAAICSADDFRCHTDGKYKFRQEENGAMHDKTFRLALNYMLLKFDLVIIDNTNLRWDELRRPAYVGIGLGYDVSIVTPQTPWAWDLDELVKRNTHEVPREIIERMLQRRQPYQYLVDRLNAVKAAGRGEYNVEDSRILAEAWAREDD
jgi:predicted kinase